MRSACGTSYAGHAGADVSITFGRRKFLRVNSSASALIDRNGRLRSARTMSGRFNVSRLCLNCRLKQRRREI